MIFGLDIIKNLAFPPPAFNEALVTTILNASFDAIVTIDTNSHVLEWNRAAETMFGFTRTEALGQDISRMIIPSTYRAQHRYGMKRWLQNKTSNVLNSRLEIKAVNKEGQEFPVELTIVPVETQKGYIFTASIRDLTEYKKREEYRDLLQREQKHRIKNIMSVVQSLAQQSFKDNPALVAPFLSRIFAMSKAQDILFAKDYISANLKDIVESNIYIHEKGDNFRIVGTPFELPPSAATSFSLVIHELCTNSVKYGALSVPKGYVNITWSVISGKLVWAWEEFNGPTVKENPVKGFGYRLITRSFTGQGDTKIEFNPKGLKCTLSLVFDDKAL